ELEVGERLARSISGKSILEYIHFSDEYSIVEINLLHHWAGKTILELDVRNKYNINIIAIRRKDRTIVSPNANERLEKDDRLIIIGEEKNLKDMERHG
ncbi:MAG: TrkA C-terminal domain-containing protein, partial [Neofamilia sp.]